MLLMYEWLSPLYGIRDDILLVMAIASLLFCIFGLMINLKIVPIHVGLYILILMNFAWAVVCFGILVSNWSEVRFLGILHLVVEALFVTALAYIEFSNRASIELRESTL